MDDMLKAMCGAYCGTCEWKERVGCKGCRACASNMFWGVCDKARCCIEHGFEHCGFCPEVPCQKLLDLFSDPEHGDSGARLRNLRNWAQGKDVFEELR